MVFGGLRHNENFSRSLWVLILQNCPARSVASAWKALPETVEFREEVAEAIAKRWLRGSVALDALEKWLRTLVK